jgi:flagellar protein FlaG
MTFCGTPVGQELITVLTIFVVGQHHCLRLNLSGSASGFPYSPKNHYTFLSMSLPPQPNVKLVNAPDYRENYANSVQMRVNVWDFFMVFGTMQQQTETHVEIKNFQGIYLSPQQAKALLGLLQQNVSGYEGAFGEIKLDPRMNSSGPVH